MARTIEEIRVYIANTPAPRLSPQSLDAFAPRASDLGAIMELANKRGLFDAISIALEYGRSIGYRMGRKEAQLARGGGHKAAQGKTAAL